MRRRNSNQRARDVANMTFYEDDERKHENYELRMVWINAEEFDEGEVVNYADERSRDDTEKHERGDDEENGAYVTYESELNKLNLIVDSGATRHLVNDKTIFESLRPL